MIRVVLARTLAALREDAARQAGLYAAECDRADAEGARAEQLLAERDADRAELARVREQLAARPVLIRPQDPPADPAWAALDRDARNAAAEAAAIPAQQRRTNEETDQ